MKSIRPLVLFVSFAVFALMVLPSVATAQCAGGSCSMPGFGYSFAPSPYAYVRGGAAPVYRQYGGSGTVYTFNDPVALNAWLAVHDPARPTVAPVPFSGPPLGGGGANPPVSPDPVNPVPTPPVAPDPAGTVCTCTCSCPDCTCSRTDSHKHHHRKKHPAT